MVSSCSHLTSGRTETIRCRWAAARPEPTATFIFAGLDESSIVSDIVAHEHLGEGDGRVETVQTLELVAAAEHHGKSVGCRAVQLDGLGEKLYEVG